MRCIRRNSCITAAMLLIGSMLMVNCSSNPVGPVAPESICGWAVGNPLDGYGLILHSLDGGNNWDRQGNVASLPNAYLIAVRAVDSLHAWAVGMPSDGYDTILSTSDAGASWTRHGDAGTIPDSGLLTLFALDADRVWVAGGDNTILRTYDGGVTWTDISDPAFDGYDWEGIHLFNENILWVVGGDMEGNGHIIHTADGGGTWTAQGDSVLLTGYIPISITGWDVDHVFLVGAHYTVARSDNGGVDWELCLPSSLERTPFSDDANGVCQVDAQTLLICLDYGKVFRTADWGDSWTELNDGGAAGGYLLLRICALNAQTAWAAGNAQLPGIIVTMSDGFNWSSQTLPAGCYMMDVSFVDTAH